MEDHHGPKRPKSHFGDIMGAEGSQGSSPALIDFDPLHRLVVTANGNLQRLISSYHNTSVTVRPIYSRSVGDGRFEREVVLICFGEAFATATSTVDISRADCIEAITTGGVAIGQLFRYLNILPTFELLGAGYEPGRGHFWRDYLLGGDGICCKIHERIRSDVFTMRAPPDAMRTSSGGALASEPVGEATDGPQASPAGDVSAADVSAADVSAGDVSAGDASAGDASAGDVSAVPAERPPTVVPSFGDIMSPNTTGFSLPDGFTPLQRVLLTANGNVERLVSSFYYEPLTVIVPLNHHRGACVYDRQVSMLVRGEPFLHAKSTIFITNPAWQRQVQSGLTPLGGMFRANHVLPTFHLRSVGRGHGSAGGGYFWRVYTLASPSMTCEMIETFADDTFDKPPAATSPHSLGASDGFGLPL